MIRLLQWLFGGVLGSKIIPPRIFCTTHCEHSAGVAYLPRDSSCRKADVKHRVYRCCRCGERRYEPVGEW